MKKIIRNSVLALSLLFAVAETKAQVVVRVRPHHERIIVTHRPPAPSPRHVWVDEDWRPARRGYVWHGGYWAEPPRPGMVWIAGHWRHNRNGWVWVPGHWR